MKNAPLIDYLDKEAIRFTELAKDQALYLLKNPTANDAAKRQRSAEDHLVRAETYKDAARIAAGHGAK